MPKHKEEEEEVLSSQEKEEDKEEEVVVENSDKKPKHKKKKSPKTPKIITENVIKEDEEEDDGKQEKDYNTPTHSTQKEKNKKKTKKKSNHKKTSKTRHSDYIDIQEINDCDIPVVFIHGFKGCYLTNPKTKKVEWIKAFKAIGVPDYPNVALPITWKDPETQDRDDLIPGKPIESVAKIVRFYGSFLKWGRNLQSVTGQSFHAFTWDWRRTPFEAVDRLLDFILGLKAPCQIIGHSMGATITYVLMKKAYERGGNSLLHRLIHSVIFVGPPFKSLPVFLEDTFPGNSTYSKMLDYKTAFTITSSYALFPVYGTELSEPEFWFKYKLSSYLATVEKPTPTELTHFNNCLNLGKKFQSILASPLPENHPPLAIIAGNKRKTKATIDIKKPDWKHPGYAMGDGRIPFECATTLPEGVRVEVIHESGKEHAVLTDEVEKIGASLSLLLDTKKKWAAKKMKK